MGISSTRQSNIELLRIVAIMMVLMVHANFDSIGEPDAMDFRAFPFDSSFRVLCQALSMTCCNIFVLISGWFGIRPSRRSFGSLLYAIVFYTSLIAVVACMIRWQVPNLRSMALMLNQNWFIASYIALYLFAPVLNGYCEKSTQSVQKNVLVAFFLTQLLLGWIAGEGYAGAGYNYGYSAFSFCGLYLLARYMNLFCPEFVGLKKSYLVCIILASLMIVLICYVASVFLSPDHNRLLIDKLMHAYNSPAAIVASVCMVLLFLQINIPTTRIINYVATSCIAVLLIHFNPNIQHYYYDYFAWLRGSFGHSLFWLLSFVSIIGIFASCWLADQLRIVSWRMLSRRINILK